jgi:hypothetical protein
MDPSGLSPYLDPAATPPFFEFTDNTYYVDPLDPANSVNIRHTCPMSYALDPAVGPFDLSLASGVDGY